MELERDMLVTPAGEVPVIEGQLVTAVRTLAGRGVCKKTIAREVGVAVNTVRRYLRQPITPGQQVRPAARRLTDDRRGEARTLYEGPAGGKGTKRSVERFVNSPTPSADPCRRIAAMSPEWAPSARFRHHFGREEPPIFCWVRT
jgi:hypothetical protein